MPAGAAWAPGAIPSRFSWLRGLPEREVERLLFAFVDVDARPGEQLVDALLGEFAVLIEACDVEVDVAVDLVGMPLFNKRLNDLYDRRDLVRGARVDRRAADAEGVGVLVVFGDEAFSEFCDRDAVLVGALYHLIVDVGEVLNVLYLVAEAFKITPEDVEHHEGSRVPYMEEIVDRRSADVETDPALFERDKFFFCSC